ncbi:hypothetical protein CPB85DRAFT_1327570 [Mucidula mucida]|nr:hypothetical protein CPB85DRAFT_1327570 [Mucidula mucida]
MHRLLEWVSTLADMFQSNSHPEFDDTVKAEFNDAFPHLTAAKVKLENGTSVERASHPAVGVVARVFVRTHRSNLGKAGSTTVTENWKSEDMEEYDTPELRAEWVEDQLRDNRFLYEFPDDPTSKGIFRGPLVITTFAYFVELYVRCGWSAKYGPPAGMLCLAVMAVKRGLTQWASGTFNKGGAFERVPWGTEAMRDFFPAASKLSEAKWDDIFGKAEALIEATRGEIHVPGNNRDEEDEDGEQPATTLFMSP